MAEEQDLASIETVKRMIHGDRTTGAPNCHCSECAALKRVCNLAKEAIDMKAAKERKRLKQGQR